MGTTQLQLYNEALVEHLGERELASLTEDREPRRVLDRIWASGAFASRVLEQGQWNFATRVSKLEYNPAITPTFGYRYAFDKPTDLVRLTGLTTDECMRSPVLHYTEETQYWFSDLTEMYIGYVSNDASFGGDLAQWPESFVRFAAAELAFAAAKRISNSKADKDDIKAEKQRLLNVAKNLDAMNGPTRFMPQGLWVSSRGSTVTRDRGSKTSLYG